MTTSGSRDFNLDVAEVIEEAYERCGLQVRTGYDAKTARRSLNLMFAEWANRGLNLWTVKQATQALTQGTSSYTLSDTVVDLLEVTLRRDSTDFEITFLFRYNLSKYISFKLFASASEFITGHTYPLIPLIITSDAPVFDVVTTGQPQASASVTTIDHPSNSDG